MNRSSLIAAVCIVVYGIAVYALVPSPAAPLPPATLSPPPTGKMPRDMKEVQLTFAPVVKRVAPAVVNVYARTVVQAPMICFSTIRSFSNFSARRRCASACSNRWDRG